MATISELEVALDMAVQKQFAELFMVLMSSTDPDEGLKRFIKGLQHLLNVEQAVAEVIHQVEDET